MFQVTRYDPAATKKRKKVPTNVNTDDQTRKKASGASERHKTEKAKPFVIAPDQSKNLRRTIPHDSVSKEAFDDLGIDLDDVVEPEVLRETGDSGVPADPESSVPESATEEVKAAFQIASLSLEEASKRLRLQPFLLHALRKLGYKNFFPVQAMSLAHIIFADTQLRRRDVCIRAPTGSGKTLGYCLPIAQALSKRPSYLTRQLRALIVLPSRDLATQVHRVMKEVLENCHLRVGLAIGQSNFTAEQIELTVDKESSDESMICHWLSLDPGNLKLALKLARKSYLLHSNYDCAFDEDTRHGKERTWSNIDVLVCTPGRLVDHLDKTKGFCLEHLEFLVIDEADRLLNQRYHNWVDRVFKAHAANQQMSRSVTPKQLQKFLVSATMTRDPQKLARLGLVHPLDLNVSQMKASSTGSSSYTMPNSLVERTVECTAQQKPLVLLALLAELLFERDETRVVIFTSNLDSTHRLARLLQLVWPYMMLENKGTVREFSSALSQQERSSLVTDCRRGEVAVVVCSDGMSRGMDLPRVQAVVNYDVPTTAKTYVHRSGRTARAGAKGLVITLLKGVGQRGTFTRMRQLVDSPQRVQGNYELQKELIRSIPYKRCIGLLREVLEVEENGELSMSAPLPARFTEEAGMLPSTRN